MKPSDLAARVVSRWLRSTPAGLALDLAPELLLGVATARLATDDELRARLRVAADQGDDRIINACRAALAGDTEARRVLGVVLEREAEATAAG